MHALGTRWEIDGIPAALITRGAGNGRYHVIFERAAATPETIEAIHWDRPAIRRVTTEEGEFGLPEGCGFDLADIRYLHAEGCYLAEVKTARQYLGDVTGYQAELETLRAESDRREAQLEELSARRAAEAAALESAYREGVELHG